MDEIKTYYGYNPSLDTRAYTNVIYVAVGYGCIKIGKSVIERADKRADELANPKYSRKIVKTVARYAVCGDETYALLMESIIRSIISYRYKAIHFGLDYFFAKADTKQAIIKDFQAIMRHAEKVALNHILQF